MSFFSTRGGSCVTASQAILNGLAPDGGLYVPAMFPPVSKEKLASLAGMSYCERASAILRTYLEDFSIPEIDAALAHAYGAEKFDAPEIAPLRQLDEQTYVMELFHGPTLAFKDMALQLLPHLITLSARKNSEEREISILVATSGDTGKAALEGFKDVPGTSCTVFYPLEGVSRVQELQMVTTGGGNTHVIGVRGNFDDAQTGVKRLFASQDFAERMHAMGKTLSSANSINFGRLVPQVVYYFSAYAELLRAHRLAVGEPVNFVVPTGNFGNILAAYYARSMGLPVGKLICASNANNVLTDFIRTGTYNKNRPFHTTASPSMDILVSSNLERLLYALCGSDTEVAGYMQQLREQGSYTVSDALKAKIQEVFAGSFCNDIQTREKIGHAWRDHRYLIDTHTAVAYHVLDDYRRETGDTTPSVVVSTASPFKFCDQVLRGIGGTADAFGPALIRRLSCETQIDAPAPLTGLDARPVRFGGCVDKAQMLHTVDEFLK